MFNAKGDDFAEFFTDAVQNAVGAPACGPHASQVVAQRLPRAVCGWRINAVIRNSITAAATGSGNFPVRARRASAL